MMDRVSGTSLINSKVITPGRYANYTIDLPDFGKADMAVREYRITALGRYLIAPRAITVKRRLMGCDVYWKKEIGSRILPGFIRRWRDNRNDRNAPLTLTTAGYYRADQLTNSGLQEHIKGIEERLQPYDTFLSTLSQLDLLQVDNIVGICQDRFGGRSPLGIKGDPAKQLNYIRQNAGSDVPVKLERAHVVDGLFELQGFDIRQTPSDTTYPLIRMTHNGKSKACVLDENHKVAFWLNTPKDIGYLQLFEYCLQTNRKMKTSLKRCLEGTATPMRLLFNRALEIDYGHAPLPAFYRELLEDNDKTSSVTKSIKQNLNHHQLGVSLNSVLQQGEDTGVLCTDISILQEMRALEPIREEFPEVFKAVTERASLSDAGRFYLLDSISGVDHDA